MFTVAQIKAAHAKVKSGADYPNYIKDLKSLGVRGYETWVKDNHSEYFGDNNYRTASQPVYAELAIAEHCDKQQFQHYLKIHQAGETDFPTFCRHCAETGIEKWIVSLVEMTCTYYDKKGNEILVEKIPS